jgi:hypothetical protein
MTSIIGKPKLFDHRQLYRMPWNLPDNVAAWLEVTTKCTLNCKGCYRENTNTHRTLDELAHELDILEATRTFDGLSIAGGEPLMHPQITEIVRMITQRGWKPAILTNGALLKEDLIKQLRDAGLYKFTIHVDSKQARPYWKGKTEIELNALRQQLAEMVARVGGVSCNFNATIYGDTLQYVPDIVAWTIQHVDIVHGMTFLCYRTADYVNYDYWADGQNVNVDETIYAEFLDHERLDLTTEDIAAKIMEVLPDYAPCTYLNGTEQPDSLKWLICGRIGTSERTYGYIGPKTVEIAQVFYHLWTGRYLSFRKPSKMGIWNWVAWMWLFDRRVRKALGNYFKDLKAFLPTLYLQTIDIQQPIDLLPDGRQNMCDGCPDMMVWNGRLVWSCRLDECLKFGSMTYTTPK